jgi:hypothetical protein
MDLQVGTNVLEEHSASIFGLGMYFSCEYFKEIAECKIWIAEKECFEHKVHSTGMKF